MPPRLRQAALVVHVSVSVGWLGAVAAFLAVAIRSNVTDDFREAQAGVLTMATLGGLVLVPLSLAALATGILQAVGTPWGLFRHYWVLAKLAINALAAGLLLIYAQSLNQAAGAAANATDIAAFRNPSPVVHSAAALVLLALAVILSVYKPRGRVPGG